MAAERALRVADTERLLAEFATNQKRVHAALRVRPDLSVYDILALGLSTISPEFVAAFQEFVADRLDDLPADLDPVRLVVRRMLEDVWYRTRVLYAWQIAWESA